MMLFSTHWKKEENSGETGVLGIKLAIIGLLGVGIYFFFILRKIEKTTF